MIDYHDLLRELGGRARGLRLIRCLSQEEVAIRAGLGESTVRRFERTGAASFENVLRIAAALGAEVAFSALFQAPKYTSIDEAIARPDSRRRRVSRQR